MKSESSAGGIIIKKRGRSWDVLLVRDMNDVYTFPKGKIEKGETPETAALREIAEETGLRKIDIAKRLTAVRYMYNRNGLIAKTVQYFLCVATGREPIRTLKEEGIHDAKWVPVETAGKIIGYEKTNRPLLEEVTKWISNLRPM